MTRMPDIIEDLVSNIPRAYYQFGNWVEVCNELAEKGKSKTLQNQRFPLFFFHAEFTSSFDNGNTSVVYSADPTIYLISESEPNYTTEQRKTNVFEAILYPLQEAFIAELVSSRLIRKINNRISYKTKDMYALYVGKDTNILPYHLDGIEIKLNLSVLKSC